MTSSKNPLRAGLTRQQAAEAAILVIFGVTGDLAARKLLPALYHQYIARRMPQDFAIVGFARRPWDDAEFRRQMDEAARPHLGEAVDDASWQSFLDHLYLQPGSFDDQQAYEALTVRVDELADSHATQGNLLYYLATPPDWFVPITTHLQKAGLVQRDHGWQRLIVEKPFGTDLASARALNRHLDAIFPESEIYRIDHYLGKETVQNLLVFRFANAIWEPLWNREHIDHVQITVAEEIGIGDRAPYYENSGALRDMLQNHMMQLLTLVAMEPPAAFAAGPIRDEKTKVLQQIRPIAAAQESARGQYSAGSVAGRMVAGYRDEADVSAGSTRETFAAIKLQIENWRWSGVPFYLRTGKRLPKKATQITIVFRNAPRVTFQAPLTAHLTPNELAIRIQPDEGIALTFASKMPGTGQERIRNVTMDFNYGTSFGVTPPDAYERLLLDALMGDPTLFTRNDEVEAAWARFDPLLAEWDEADDVPRYSAGSWGPSEADALIERDGRRWRAL
ncbi:MAG: glucose-6-phosphate dehydrogenase [Anaerolineales bacterium]|nr:glucose-6-phosphate dehydrogenase [Anaerolineales bacterium]